MFRAAFLVSIALRIEDVCYMNMTTRKISVPRAPPGWYSVNFILTVKKRGGATSM